MSIYAVVLFSVIVGLLVTVACPLDHTATNGDVCDRAFREVSCEIHKKKEIFADMYQRSVQTINNKTNKYLHRRHTHIEKLGKDIASWMSIHKCEHEYVRKICPKMCNISLGNVELHQAKVLNKTTDCCRVVHRKSIEKMEERWFFFFQWWENSNLPMKVLKVEQCSSRNNNFTNVSHPIGMCSKTNFIVQKVYRFHNRLIEKEEKFGAWLDKEIKSVESELTKCTDNRHLHDLNRESLLITSIVEKCIKKRLTTLQIL